MVSKINCCKDCVKRTVGCHSTCPAYCSERDALEKSNELKLKASIDRHDRYYVDHFYKARKKSKYFSGLKRKIRYW